MTAVGSSTHSTARDYFITMGNTFSLSISISTNGGGPMMYGGSATLNSSVVAAASTFYAVTGANGATSVINASGTENSGSAGTQATQSPLTLGSDGTNEYPLTGYISEAALWASGLNLAQRAALHANQSAYWGTA
jgi:hypothetical protein